MEKTIRSSGRARVHMDEQLKFSSRPCWTCRKKRVKCDGCLPTCFKCRMKGRECLGYNANRPLVWAGLASRGKMVHQSFEDQALKSSAETRQLISPKQLLARTLADPIFQDLSPRSVQYLSYYVHRCCVECTLYEPDSPNCFKQFLTLMPGNPVLVHSILAISAFHQARSTACAHNASQGPILLEQPSIDCMDVTSISHSGNLASSQYSDAIAHSSLSMSALRVALANASDSLDALLATVLILIWLDVVDSGKMAWKHHLEGLKVLISLQRASQKGTTGLRAFFVETFAILSLIGSTFDSNLLQLLDIFPQSELDEILEKTELHSWTGCPSNLLSTLRVFNVSALSSDHPSLQEIHQWVAQLRQFDTTSWAVKCPRSASVHIRYSLGEAWKGAIEIYGRRVLGGRCSDIWDVPNDLVETALSHLMQIDHRDTHFKGTVWPAFVVGAEAQTMQQREAILNIFGHLIEFLHLSMLHIAIIQLKRVWARSTPYPEGTSWIHEIWERREGLLLL
ncbi:fungal-specific transcription factor domain-containing protein [Hypoxylon sp. NC0597]|nr:fungal-specific transcription factor domain-containing protein [Hypoxylon sp. NC0597]